jgi:hypothetical protein
MIGFDDESVTALQALVDEGRGMAEVGHDPHADTLAFDHESERPSGIVRHRESVDAKGTEIETLRRLDRMPRGEMPGREVERFEGLGRTRHRDPMTVRESLRPAGMIGVLVRQQHAADGRRRDTDSLETAPKLKSRKTGIDQHTAPADLHENGISVRAAAQR